MKTYLYFLFTLLPASIIACDCAYTSTICENNEINESLTHIFQGRKIGQFEHGMDFEIYRILQGEETKQVIRIWGDSGFGCGTSTEFLSTNREFIIGVSMLETDMENSIMKAGEYSIPWCGSYVFDVGNEEAMENLNKCLGDIVPICPFGDIIYFPNPVKETLFINIPVEWGDYEERSIEL